MNALVNTKFREVQEDDLRQEKYKGVSISDLEIASTGEILRKDRFEKFTKKVAAELGVSFFSLNELEAEKLWDEVMVMVQKAGYRPAPELNKINEVVEGEKDKQSIDWSKVERGDMLWYEDSEDTCPGGYCRFDHYNPRNNTVVVSSLNKTRSFSRDSSGFTLVDF